MNYYFRKICLFLNFFLGVCYRISLVPKLHLGTQLNTKLCFVNNQNIVFNNDAFPNRVWERAKI